MLRYSFSIVLALTLLGTAMAVVYVQHERRRLFVALQQLERERDQMEVQWGRLRLERSAWTANNRIEELAQKRLNMHLPPAHTIVLVTP